MTLLVDIGNTRIKWAAVASGRSAARVATLDRFERPAERATAVFDRVWGALQPQPVIACGVAGPEAMDALREWVRRRWARDLVEVRAQVAAGGLVNAYPSPGTLGADRWANLLGARALHGAVDMVIVDAGTAVTVDALRADGRHLGGAILAGLAASRQGLAAAAPMLPAATDDTALPSDHSAGAIAAGTLHALIGGIERVAREVGRELDRPRALITGGDAECLGSRLGPAWRIEPALTLQGLRTFEEAGCAG